MLPNAPDMHFDADPHTSFIGLMGSHAYGMARDGSDVDLRGCVVPPRAIRESIHRHFEQFERREQRGPWGPRSEQALAALRAHPTGGGFDGPLDVCLFSLPKLVKLAAANNPNILELLFLDPREVLYADETWHRLAERRQLFLSRRCRHTYAGYAHSQLKRIKGHREWLLNPPDHEPTRAEFGLPEHSTLSADDRDRIEAALAKIVAEWRLEDGLESQLGGADLDCLRDRIYSFYAATLKCREEDVEHRLATVAGSTLELSDELLHVLGQERRYRSARKQWQQYRRWQQERNATRAALEAHHGYDTKHGAHLIRLMRTGLEVLAEGKLRVRRPDAEELLAIRNGAWSYDRLMEEAQRIESQLEGAAAASSLPNSPDLEAIDGLLLELLPV